MYACYYGNSNLIDRIVDLDPMTLFATNSDQQTPLMIATMSGNVSIVNRTFHVSKKKKHYYAHTFLNVSLVAVKNGINCVINGYRN